MQVYVRTQVGALNLQVNPSDNILSLKQKIQTQQGQYIEAMVLQHNGITLDNYKRIQDYSIPNQAEIFLILQQIQIPQTQVFQPISTENAHMAQPAYPMFQGQMPQGYIGFMPQGQIPYENIPQRQIPQAQTPQAQLQYPQQQNHRKDKTNQNQSSTFISHILIQQDVDPLNPLNSAQNVVVAKIVKKKEKVHQKMLKHLEECKHEECKKIFPNQPFNMDCQQSYNNVKMPPDYRIGFKK